MTRGNFIGGSWVPGAGAQFDSLNPATQQSIWRGNESTPADVASSAAAARQAFDGWRVLSMDTRVGYVQQYKSLLQARAESIARLISEETGKILWDAKGEVAAMIGKVDISLRAHAERTGESSSEQGGIRQVLRHRPHGVLAVFGPYNFPGHLPNGHIVPALIAGNTLVFKPSEQTPRVAEEMVALWQEAGLPAGVLNLVQGARATGEALAAHPEIDGILFTGSAEVGALLHKQFGGQPGKMLALEMGGNNPLIVDGVKNVEAAALLIAQSAYLSTGQRCTCARRLILPAGAEGDAVIKALLALIPRLTLGGYDEVPEPFMGPLISNREADKIIAAFDALAANGGKPLAAPRRPQPDKPFITPALIDVTAVKAREDREYFGPLLQVIRVADFEAAIDEANRTRFGLAAGLISDDRARYEHFIRDIRAGVVNWNRPTNGASSALPFGGVGASGNHRPSAYYAADYAAYPVASQESDTVALPATPIPGIR